MTMTTRYKEESSIRAWLKKQALLKGKVKRSNKSDPVIAPYMYFFYCLSDQETSIEKVFAIIQDAEKTKLKAAADLKAKSKTSTDPTEISDELRLEAEAVSYEEAQDVFAGTLFIL
ncbi:MAG TPA: hypothetical protein V6C69_07175, partial [Trichormus sp.]